MFFNAPLCIRTMPLREMYVSRRRFQIRMPHETHQRERVCTALDRSRPVGVSQIIGPEVLGKPPLIELCITRAE